MGMKNLPPGGCRAIRAEAKIGSLRLDFGSFERNSRS
jgi:hypothetical protein